ncbi:adhesion G-protein coupled receptor G6-like [Thunnus albacares]|uniref:adhesion G-protein coupled receptor G6-like n=1 Tax=Thunnus albacares TaxID=8236 RepID=UPI001CF6F421|nr:adhesion G-protein coupled receptor G6-like [Thunnus albacares]
MVMQKIPSLRIMFPLDVKHRWMFVVKIAILFYGMFPKNINSCSTDTHNQRKILTIVSTNNTGWTTECYSTLQEVNLKYERIKLCFSCKEKKTECCGTYCFNPEINVNHNGDSSYSVILKKNILSRQDIVLVTSPLNNFSCMPSKLFDSSDQQRLWSHSKILKCLMSGNKVIKLDEHDCGEAKDYVKEDCEELGDTKYNMTFSPGRNCCISCKLPGKKPDISLSYTSTGNSTGDKINIMNDLGSLVKQMGNSSTAAITMGDVTGVISKLPQQINEQTNINLGISKNGDMNILENSNYTGEGFTRVVQIPKEASTMAVKRNGSFAGVLLFPGIQQKKSDSYFINSEMVGIEMGANISNLSHTIDILYTNVDKKGNIASCRSWDGKGEQVWITDGCKTKEFNGSITCQCTHLTFFAILMSPPTGNISSSDFKSLTYITSIGCGLSMFFLAVALFMHCLIRKGAATQATKILINLLVAMFIMNLSFLINETISKIATFGVCIVMAAVMHYSLLATFTWFFIEALHLCFNLWKLPGGIKHYMTKICITGWVTPAVVVVTLLALQKYGKVVIYTNDGNSAKMCWIPDAAIHQGVNVGYYAVVFIFTVSIFIITVRQIVLFKHTAGKTQHGSSTKTNTFSIVGLFFLLGITWAFAFFSHEPMLIPSYYIFTILNSFQGFFLFIYYYTSSKIVEENTGSSDRSSGSKEISKTVLTSPYQ